jgi:serine/threonine protein phosphatase PrpC/CRP-like cAMP-binding protein
MRFSAHAQTHVGQRRTNNEDFHLLAPELGLYVVCDGLGGHANGEVASRTAANTIHGFLRERKDALSGFVDTPEQRQRILALVDEAVQAACAAVYVLSPDGVSRSRSATTMTLLLTLDRHALMAHVGDTRLYVARGGELHQLSDDHTYLAEFVRRGEIDPAKAKEHKLGNVVSRALGQHEVVKVDTLLFEVIDGDTYLLCSDGLTRHVPEPEEIRGYLVAPDIDAVPGRLIDLANERGGKDNVTILVVRAAAEAERAEEADRTESMAVRFDVLRSVSIFHYLNHREMLEILNISKTKVFEAGQAVIEEGSLDDGLYVALDGKLVVIRDAIRVAELLRGSHFGEMALLRERPRSATVRAEERTTLLVLHRQPFFELIRSEPALGVKLLWSMARALSNRLDDVTAQLALASPTLEIDLESMPFALSRSQPRAPSREAK